MNADFHGAKRPNTARRPFAAFVLKPPLRVRSFPAGQPPSGSCSPCRLPPSGRAGGGLIPFCFPARRAGRARPTLWPRPAADASFPRWAGHEIT